ncbi:PE family protein [Williamsia sp. SKLECPSW1]
MPDNLSVDTEYLADAAGRLEAIAAGLEQQVGTHRETVDVRPAGADEVSRAASTSFSESAERFDAEMAKGVAAIRDVAAALRQQSAAVGTHDEAVAGDLFVN